MTEVTDATFQAQVLDARGLALVEFGGEHCAPCRQLEPILAELERELGGRVRVYTVDADHNIDTAARFGVRGLPTLLLFKDGAEVRRLIGMQSKQKLAKTIQEVAP